MKVMDELLTEGRISAENTVFIQVATPSRERVEQYRLMRQDIEAQVGHINGAHGRIGRAPIHYLHSSYPRDELAAMFQAATVAFVTPLRDGMNLVAKEFVASRFDNTGVLVLSEFAGAADEFRQALLVNPYDMDAMKRTLVAALHMPARRAGEADALDAAPGQFVRHLRLGRRVPVRPALRVLAFRRGAGRPTA